MFYTSSWQIIPFLFFFSQRSLTCLSDARPFCWGDFAPGCSADMLKVIIYCHVVFVLTYLGLWVIDVFLAGTQSWQDFPHVMSSESVPKRRNTFTGCFRLEFGACSLYFWSAWTDAMVVLMTFRNELCCGVMGGRVCLWLRMNDDEEEDNHHCPAAHCVEPF